MGPVGRPRKYDCDADRVAAWRARKREQRAIEDRIYREAQEGERRRLEYLRSQGNDLINLAHALARKRYPLGDLPNGYTALTDALDLLACAVENPHLVDDVLRAAHAARSSDPVPIT